MKKFVALALCLVMVLGLMAGCQKKTMDVETLVKNMDEAAKTVTAQGGNMKMELEMKITATGMTMNMGMDMDMEVRAKADGSSAYTDMTMTMEALGQTEETSSQMYFVMEDDSMVCYLYESTSDIWIKTSAEEYTAMLGIMDTEQSVLELPMEMLSLAEEQETVNGRKCYVLTEEMKGESEEFKAYMGDYMDQVMGQMAGTEMDEDSMAYIADMDWSKLSAKAVYHVDAETFLPVDMTMEILGMGEVMSDLMKSMMGELAAEEDMEVSMEIPTFKITMTNVIYNDDVEVPTVPQEALDNAIDADAMIEESFVDNELFTNEPQADGSYRMTLGGDSVSVMVPEGYDVYAAEDEMVVCMTADMMNGVNYMLVGDITGEDMKAGVMEEVTWAQENDYYKSHSDVAELNGFQTMSLIYNDDTSLWYAWKELDGCILLIGAEVSGESLDLAGLIGTVVLTAE